MNDPHWDRDRDRYRRHGNDGESDQMSPWNPQQFAADPGPTDESPWRDTSIDKCGCGHLRGLHTGNENGITACNGTAGDLDPGDFLPGDEAISDPSLPCLCTSYGRVD